MQLKLKRSQKTGGVMASTIIFCLDARVEFTAEEQHSVTRYKLHNQLIYTSEGARRAAEGRAESAAYAKASTISIGSVDSFLSSATSKLGHGLKAAAFGAVSAMRLTITVASLQRGQHIECKSLDELMGAEEAIMEACQNLKGYLGAASAFDGSEVLIDFSGDMPTVVAQATTPTPQLMAPAAAASYAAADTDQISESWPEQAQYAAKPETFGLPFDWNDPATRKKILIAGGFVLGLLMLRACNIL